MYYSIKNVCTKINYRLHKRRRKRINEHVTPKDQNEVLK